jgi:hypothetical protein
MMSVHRGKQTSAALPIALAFGKVRLDHAQLFYVGQIGLVSGDNAAMLSSRS